MMLSQEDRESITWLMRKSEAAANMIEQQLRKPFASAGEIATAKGMCYSLRRQVKLIKSIFHESERVQC